MKRPKISKEESGVGLDLFNPVVKHNLEAWAIQPRKLSQMAKTNFVIFLSYLLLTLFDFFDHLFAAFSICHISTSNKMEDDDDDDDDVFERLNLSNILSQN